MLMTALGLNPIPQSKAVENIPNKITAVGNTSDQILQLLEHR
jgi:hypothetical protein